MGNSLRRWLACILPCGAFDIVRVVHINGHVEEHSHRILAGDVLAANPGHILSHPCSHGVVPRVIVLSPQTILKRGHIYFLVPKSSPQEEEKKKKKKQQQQQQKKKDEKSKLKNGFTSVKTTITTTVTKGELVMNGGQLPRVVPLPKNSVHRRCRSVPTVVWRPRLEQISEDPLKYPPAESSEL